MSSKPARAITYLQHGNFVFAIGPSAFDLERNCFIFAATERLPPPHLQSQNWRDWQRFRFFFNLFQYVIAQFAANRLSRIAHSLKLFCGGRWAGAGK
jgi:hypothetical protein